MGRRHVRRRRSGSDSAYGSVSVMAVVGRAIRSTSRATYRVTSRAIRLTTERGRIRNEAPSSGAVARAGVPAVRLLRGVGLHAARGRILRRRRGRRILGFLLGVFGQLAIARGRPTLRRSWVRSCAAAAGAPTGIGSTVASKGHAAATAPELIRSSVSLRRQTDTRRRAIGGDSAAPTGTSMSTSTPMRSPSYSDSTTGPRRARASSAGSSARKPRRT